MSVNRVSAELYTKYFIVSVAFDCVSHSSCVLNHCTLEHPKMYIYYLAISHNHDFFSVIIMGKIPNCGIKTHNFEK